MGEKKKSKNAGIDLIAGGTAGLFEALCCHPLDTIKVRMQLSSKQGGKGPDGKPIKKLGFIGTGLQIAKRETPLGLYKGLGAVVTGIIPKMSIRFSSYEFYKKQLTPSDGSKISTGNNFIAGVGAGLTEAVIVVNPTEVIKIRLQAQNHSMVDPLDVPKYRNAAHALLVVVREEGFSALYRGVALTAARQASNQGVNFTVYAELKSKLQELQPQYDQLPSWQTSIIGLISGALGPLSNAPLDTIKTRMQREGGASKESGLSRFTRITKQLIAQEGIHALYKGITPRIMRVAPGQAVTFTVYEYIRDMLENLPSLGSVASTFEE